MGAHWRDVFANTIVVWCSAAIVLFDVFAGEEVSEMEKRVKWLNNSVPICN